MLNFYILDTETNGLKAGYHEIHQFSIIKNVDLSTTSSIQLSRNIKVSHPERTNPLSLAVSGKTPLQLRIGNLISTEELVESVDNFLLQDLQTPEHRCIVAHNAPFDRRFVWATWAKYGKKFPANLWLCTQKLGKIWTKEKGLKLDSYKLDSLVKYAKIEARGKQHDATSDAQNLFLLWVEMQRQGVDYLPTIQRLPHEF